MHTRKCNIDHPSVLIVGAGALGKSFAGLLADQASVMMYERNPMTSRMLMKGGFILKEGRYRKNVKVRVLRSLAEIKNEKIDVLIFATKIRDLRGAVSGAASLNPQYIFIPQNGIFDIRWIKSFFKKARICRGVTTMACQEISQNQVELFYRGNTYIGASGAMTLASFFCKCGIEAKAYHDPQGAIWSKLIFSAVMNPLPVITGQPYDVLRNDHEIWILVRRAINEGRVVARSLGIRLAFNPLKLVHRVRDGDLAGIRHRGSIIQDVSAKIPTELDFITGALIRHARRLKVKTPGLDLIFSKTKSAGA